MEPAQPIQLVTATLTLDEVIFTLLQEMIARAPYHVPRNRSQYLHDHPDVVQALMTQIDPLVEALSDLVVWESVTAVDIHEMRREMCSSDTLPRDSIHLAVMQ